jgi:hypothetical protein
MHSGDAPFSVGSAAQGADKPATVQQCHEVIDAQARQIEALRDRLTQQDRLLAELQERMTLSSRNSSKPPSSDGPGVSRGDKHKRARRQRSRGAQRGHPGAYRQLLDQADVHAIHECAPPSHCECGAAVAVRGKPLRHQVFDVAPVAAEVNEYRLYSGYVFTPPPITRSWRPSTVRVGEGEEHPEPQPDGGATGTKLGWGALSIQAVTACCM